MNPPAPLPRYARRRAQRFGHGALAQLGERLHGMQEVRGSTPLGSTKPPSPKKPNLQTGCVNSAGLSNVTPPPCPQCRFPSWQARHGLSICWRPRVVGRFEIRSSFWMTGRASPSRRLWQYRGRVAPGPDTGDLRRSGPKARLFRVLALGLSSPPFLVRACGAVFSITRWYPHETTLKKARWARRDHFCKTCLDFRRTRPRSASPRAPFCRLRASGGSGRPSQAPGFGRREIRGQLLSHSTVHDGTTGRRLGPVRDHCVRGCRTGHPDL